MSHYIEILAVQSPFEFSIDALQRVMWSVNFDLTSSGPVANLEEEVSKLISDAGYGTLGTDMFIGSLSLLPTDSPGPFVTIKPTSGFSPHETHNGTRLEKPSVQIIVTAGPSSPTFNADEEAAGRIRNIWRELDGQRDIDVTYP